MAIFDYRGEDGREVIAEAYQLATYSTIAPVETSILGGLTGIIAHDPSPEAGVLPEGWREVSPEELGLDPSVIKGGGFFGIGSTPYYTDDGSLVDGEAKVLAKEDANGNIIKLSISFAATNSIGSVIDITNLTELAYDDGFDYLFEALRDFAVANDVSGRDVLFTGYSLGAAGSNFAALEREERLDGFFADSDYISFAAPALAEGENVYNFGFENDVVHRVGGSDPENIPDFIDIILQPNRDLGAESSVDNTVVFNDSYANPAFPFGYFGILNPIAWLAHVDGALAGPRLFNTIATSHFYELMERDSVIIISNLSDLARPVTWVQPLDRPTGNNIGEDSFILGSKDSDKLGDSTGSDFLDGYAGNDTFRISEGNDTVHGGEGTDTVNMGGSIGDYEVVRLSDGTTYFYDTEGRYGLEELIDVEKVDLGFAQTYRLEDDKVKWGWFGAKRYDSATEGTDDADSLTGGNGRDRMFGQDGNDNINGAGGHDLLHGGYGDDNISGGTGNDQLFGSVGNDFLSGDAGDDLLSGGIGTDTFAFASGWGDDIITDFNMGEEDDLIIFTSDVFSSYEEVLNATSQSGNDVLISNGSDSLLIEDITLSDLQSDNFIFA